MGRVAGEPNVSVKQEIMARMMGWHYEAFQIQYFP
jgi:hypothetical protein